MEIKIKNWFDKKDKIDFTKESSEEIREKIKYNKEYHEQGYEEIEKRKENTLGELIEEEFDIIISCGMGILVFGLLMLGGTPTYFGVDDYISNGYNVTLDNGTIVSGGINQSMDLVKDAGIKAIYSFTNVGKENPSLYFWVFWIVVFMFMILPVIKIIYYIITWKKKTKKI